MTDFMMWENIDYWNAADNILMLLYGLGIISEELYESKDYEVVAAFCERMGKDPDSEIRP